MTASRNNNVLRLQRTLELPTLTVELPTNGGRWVFELDDKDYTLSTSTLKTLLADNDAGDYHLAYFQLDDQIVLEDGKEVVKRFMPHRVVVKTVRAPKDPTDFVKRDALTAMLYAVKAEMDAVLDTVDGADEIPYVRSAFVNDRFNIPTATIATTTFQRP